MRKPAGTIIHVCGMNAQCRYPGETEMLGCRQIISCKMIVLHNMSTKITYSQLSKIIDIIEETKNKLRSNCNFNISIQVMTLNIYEVIK